MSTAPLSDLVPAGTPLVLLNAFPVDRSQWEPLVAALADRVPGDIITFDMPGIGEMPLPDDEPSLDIIADAAVLAMREVTGHRAAVWAGCSMGGYVAMAVAERHADAVAGLVFMATKATEDTPEARAGRLALADRLDGLAAHPDARGAAEALIGTVGEDRDGLVAQVETNIASHGAAGIAWGQRAMAARPDRMAVLAGLDVPVAVVGGELDGVVPVDVISGLANGCEVTATIIPGVGHLVMLEAPEVVATAVLEVVNAAEQAPPSA